MGRPKLSPMDEEKKKKSPHFFFFTSVLMQQQQRHNAAQKREEPKNKPRNQRQLQSTWINGNLLESFFCSLLYASVLCAFCCGIYEETNGELYPPPRSFPKERNERIDHNMAPQDRMLKYLSLLVEAVPFIHRSFRLSPTRNHFFLHCCRGLLWQFDSPNSVEVLGRK